MAASVPEETLPSAAAQAKRLLRISRTGALATLGRESGAPLTTWVGFASDFFGAPLFLFSEIAQHTKNLGVDPRGPVGIETGASCRRSPWSTTTATS